MFCLLSSIWGIAEIRPNRKVTPMSEILHDFLIQRIPLSIGLHINLPEREPLSAKGSVSSLLEDRTGLFYGKADLRKNLQLITAFEKLFDAPPLRADGHQQSRFARFANCQSSHCYQLEQKLRTYCFTFEAVLMCSVVSYLGTVCPGLDCRRKLFYNKGIPKCYFVEWTWCGRKCILLIWISK